MNSSHANRKDIFYIIILILTFITVIVGATFAIYTWIFSQEEGSSAVYTGTLSIDYLSGNVIYCNTLLPINSPTLETKQNVYKNHFKVKNTGSLDVLLEVIVEFYVNEFSNQTLMYALYNTNGDELSSGYLEGRKSTIVAKDVHLETNTEGDYVLLIWLKDNGENQNTEMRKVLTGTIRVDASQKLD